MGPTSATAYVAKTPHGRSRPLRHVEDFAAAAGLASRLTLVQSAPFMIVGNDEKRLWDDQFNPLLSPPGRDSVLIVDLADPMNPKIVANLPLKNSVVLGLPVNLAIISWSIALSPTHHVMKQVSDDKVHSSTSRPIRPRRSTRSRSGSSRRG